MKEQAEKHIPLYLITGFLGSGKTSVINHLLDEFAGKRIGLVLNDFGQIEVDSSLVPTSGKIHTKGLHGGQIFCSCLSGSFIDTVLEFSDFDPDLVLVETSGLSKPTPLLEIISLIQEKSGHRFSYRGMICVIDAERYPTLSQSLLTLEEQVVFSDLFIINKTDLVDEAALAQIEASLRQLQPLGRMVRTTLGNIPTGMLDIRTDNDRLAAISTGKYHGWGSFGRPGNCVFSPTEPATAGDLEKFLRDVAPLFYRIKGFIDIGNDKWVYISTVGSQIEIRDAVSQTGNTGIGLVCLYRADILAKEIIADRWKQLTGGTVRISAS